jgi:hypothetical protein
MAPRSVWDVFDAYEQLVEAYLAASGSPGLHLQQPSAPVASMLSLENCMDLFNARSVANSARGLMQMQNLEELD